MPLDQMHSANPPSHPELLAWLARDTADHGYDLRRLIRGLVLSRAYARGSSLGRRGAAPAVALRRGRRAAADADATGDARCGWRPSTRQACRRTSKSEAFEKRIEALEDSARPLADVVRDVRAATPRSAWPRPCSSATASRSHSELLADGAGPARRAPEADRRTEPS